MRLRKLLLAASTVVAAGVIVIAPSAMATPNNVDVGRPNGTYPIYLTFRSASTTMALYGIPTSITCTSGSATGSVSDNDGQPPVVESLWISAMTLTCPSIFPGTTVSLTMSCAVPYIANSNYTSASTDVVVGQTNFTSGGTDCAGASISNGCTFRIGGTPATTFDENTQRLSVNGSAVIHNVSGCLGAVANGQTFTVNALYDIALSPPAVINIL